MGIMIDKIVTKNRWEDSFSWKQPTPEEQQFLEKLKNVHNLSIQKEMLESSCKEYASLAKQFREVKFLIEQASNDITKKALLDKASYLKDKISHIERIIGRKLAISAIKNYPEIMDFDLEKFDVHAKNYQEVIAHRTNKNLPLDYYGVFGRLIKEKHGMGSAFQKRSGVEIGKALDYGDLQIAFDEEDLDSVITYISNPRSSSISEDANKYFDTYFDGITKKDILENGANPNLDWFFAKKQNLAKGNVKDESGSEPGEMGE